MNILIIDDSKHVQMQLRVFLNQAGHTDLLCASSGMAALALLGIEGGREDHPEIDLILMDIEMPEMDGISATSRIKAVEHYQDVPVIIVSGDTNPESLQAAFNAGAVDFIKKPVAKVELLARVHSVLKLKQEIDGRKAREKELVELASLLSETNGKLQDANEKLKLMALVDGLTGIANRRHFDQTLAGEWRRLSRAGKPLAIIMIDIDLFKAYNDLYGHLAGDGCIKQIAARISAELKRPGDFVARYGGEEFAVVLPETDAAGAAMVGRNIDSSIARLSLPHVASPLLGSRVTVSMGVAAMVPEPGMAATSLVGRADNALYRAKQEGRNRMSIYQEN